MANVNDQIRSKLEGFVEELSELIRQAAMETVSAAIGGTMVTTRRRVGRPSNGHATAARARRKGAKRDPSEIEGTVKKLLSFIKSNPGQGIEHISKGLGVSTKELALPVKKLIGEKSVKTRGQKRATKYFPV